MIPVRATLIGLFWLSLMCAMSALAGNDKVRAFFREGGRRMAFLHVSGLEYAGADSGWLSPGYLEELSYSSQRRICSLLGMWPEIFTSPSTTKAGVLTTAYSDIFAMSQT